MLVQSGHYIIRKTYNILKLFKEKRLGFVMNIYSKYQSVTSNSTGLLSVTEKPVKADDDVQNTYMVYVYVKHSLPLTYLNSNNTFRGQRRYNTLTWDLYGGD